MVTINCPWCELDETIELNLVHERDASFECPDCGTSVSIVDEPVVRLELAA